MIIDIDNGEIDLTRIDLVPPMPQTAAENFISKCNDALRNYEIFELGRYVCGLRTCTYTLYIRTL